ncbi:hypothetical protein AB6A40_006052 [Gnathostoma spinigerum]|uniref:diacylglycerol cholinephosphotransferase n=1 Tax=Gnathostoma spinigerum TaxID=75299 RepID=A0ABD6EH95_9BILA
MLIPSVPFRFWDYVVTFCPMWLAPNLITLVGLIINVVTVLVFTVLSNSAHDEVSSWVYLQAALGLFLYQTLDAMDGRQARRSHSSSPLGELFDHGCDSVTQVLVTLNVCCSMRLGNDRYSVLLVSVLAVVIFYTAHWSTYCTGQLRFSKFDVTEAQMCIIFSLLLTALFGANMWLVRIFGMQLRYITLLLCSFICLWQLAKYMVVIFSEGIGKNGSTVADTSVLFPLFPLLAVIVPFFMVYSKSQSGIYDQHIAMFVLCLGAVAAKAANRLIIAHMSRSELNLWDWIYLAPIGMMLNQYYDFYIDEYKLLVVATIYAYASLLLFSAMICRQFCAHLNIYCFTLGPRVDNVAATNNNRRKK